MKMKIIINQSIMKYIIIMKMADMKRKAKNMRKMTAEIMMIMKANEKWNNNENNRQ